MKTCVIFCAAGFDGLIENIEKDALVIAADGGLVHTEGLGIVPGVILGDFDSLGYVPVGANVFPVEKDDTDAMLAVKVGLAQGCGRFCSTAVWTAPVLTTPLPIFRPCNTWQTTGQRGISLEKTTWSQW